MARKTKEDALATKSAILDAAEQVFYRKGVSHTSLDDIAKEAFVTRGAVYWHFKNKLEIFEAMHQRVHQPVSEMFTQAVNQKTKNSLQIIQDLCVKFIVDLKRNKQKNRVYSIFYLKCEYTTELQPIIDRITRCKKDNFNALCDFFEYLQDQGEVQKQLAPKHLALSLFSFLNGVTLEYLRDPSRFSFPKDAEALVEIFFQTLRVPKKMG